MDDWQESGDVEAARRRIAENRRKRAEMTPEPSNATRKAELADERNRLRFEAGPGVLTRNGYGDGGRSDREERSTLAAQKAKRIKKAGKKAKKRRQRRRRRR